MSAHCVVPVTHPAILKSRELYDKAADLSYQEFFFCRRVGEIVGRTASTEQAASQLFGKNSGAYRASCDLSQRQEQADLDAALAYFLASAEQQCTAEERAAYRIDHERDYRKNYEAVS